MAGSGERAGCQHHRQRWNGKPELLGKDPRQQHHVSMLDQKFEGAVHRAGSGPCETKVQRNFSSKNYFEMKSAVCPHLPLMTNSRMGLRTRGAVSRSRYGWGREAGSPGWPMANAAIASQPAGISKTSRAVSGSNPAIWWTRIPRDMASVERYAMAAPES